MLLSGGSLSIAGSLSGLNASPSCALVFRRNSRFGRLLTSTSSESVSGSDFVFCRRGFLHWLVSRPLRFLPPFNMSEYHPYTLVEHLLLDIFAPSVSTAFFGVVGGLYFSILKGVNCVRKSVKLEHGGAVMSRKCPV
jgi:hypothetical protein